MTTIPTTVQERVLLPGSAAPGSIATAKALTPADIVAMLKQRMVTIIILSVLLGAIAVGVFFLLYLKFPGYSAEAMVECISDMPAQPMQIEQETLADDPYDRFVRSQAMLLVSRTNLSNVLQDVEVRGTQWFASIPQDERLIELEEEISCAPIRDSNFIRVAMSTHSPLDPHKIVNRVVQVYLDDVKDKAMDRYRDELAAYRRELADVRDQVQLKKEQIRNFQASLPAGEGAIDGGTIGNGLLIEQLRLEQEEVSTLELQTTELESLLRIYSDPEGAAVTPEDRLAVEQDLRVNQLDNQVFSLEQELRVLLAQFGPNHREYLEMVRRLDEAESQLSAARANKLREVVDFKRQQIETAYYNSQNALLHAKERLQETQARQADLDRKLSELQTLFDERNLLVETQNRLDEYIQEIDRIVHKSEAIRVEWAIRATEPLERSFPSLFMLPALVILAGLLAVGMGLGLELIDNSIKTAQDVSRHVGLPVLGSIPDVDDEEMEIERVETAVRDAPKSMVTEAFRSVRSNLQFSAPADRLKSILITSPRPEDGRTTVAANLALSLAAGGKRVLLVDANLRKPTLHKLFPECKGAGLTNIVIGETEAADCVRRTSMSNLDVVGSGPLPPNPAELLGNELFRAFMAGATQQYDHLIFDSPPALLASDASVISTIVDGAILVCRARDNSRGIVQRAKSMLVNVNAHVFGVVLNVAQARRGGYFREQLRTFYEYQLEGEEAGAGELTLPAGSKEDKLGGEGE